MRCLKSAGGLAQPKLREAELRQSLLLRGMINARPRHYHDFQCKNYMVRNISLTTDAFGNPTGNVVQEDNAVTLIDWEKSGWFLNYWEYCTAVYSVRWNDDWGEWAERILYPFVSEYAWMQMLRTELWS